MVIPVNMVTLVVRRPWLDGHYPGGSERFISDGADTAAAGCDIQHDRHMVAISATDGAAMGAIADGLVSRGAIGLDAVRDEFVEFAFVESSGPTHPCPWIVWHVENDGHAAIRYAIDPAAGTSLKLGQDGGLEHWIDFETGRVVSVGRRTTMDAVREMCAERNWELDELSTDTFVGIHVDCGPLLNLPVQFTVDERERAVVMRVFIPGHPLEELRPAIAEFIVRANDGLGFGAFDLAWDEGDISYRTGLRLIETEPTRPMIAAMVDAALSTVWDYAPGIMRVARGESALAVITDIQRTDDAEESDQ